MATTDPPLDYCLKDDCKVKTRKKDCDMIRCVFCHVRHHTECVSIPKDQVDQIWTCFACRQLTETVKELKTELSVMHAQQGEMMTLLRDINSQFLQEKQARTKAEGELSLMRKELSDLKLKIASSMTMREDSLNNTASSPNDEVIIPTAPPLPAVLVGTSLLRNVDPEKLQDCDVIAKGGASISDLNATLHSLPDEKEYSHMTIVAGSVDIENRAVAEVVTDYLALITTASSKAEKISICSVLPRTDKELSEKMTKLNDELRKNCQDEGHTFVDMDDTFRLRNGKANSACLLPDGLHLTKYGVDLLMQGCAVKLKPGIDSVFSDKRYKKVTGNEQLLFKGHESPFSNFFPVPGLNVDGILFATTEAAYVYQKALYHGDRRTASAVINSQTGIHAKRLGDKIITTAAWQQKKVDIMDNLIRIKLDVCYAARKALKDSGEKQLVEDTSNAFWGRGTDNKGNNMLGRIWMLYRTKMESNAPQRSIRRTWASRNHQPKCYRCGEPGHLLEQCRQRADMKCWNCRSTGHKQKHCRQVNQDFSR